jgi:ankyrin repeat protein
MWNDGGLPIHVALANAQTAFISVWMDELHLAPDVRHPETHASLLAYTLEQKNISEQELVEVVTELARLGVAMRSPGESPVANAIADRKKPPTALVRQLLKLGADINAIDDKTGMTALTLVLHQMHEFHLCDAEPCWMTDSQSVELVSQLVQQGARPELAGASGESAQSIAELYGDQEILEMFGALARSSN